MRRLPGITESSNRLRNIFIALLAMLCVAFAAWWAVQNYFGIDRYRAMLIDRIQTATGRPCTIGSMVLHFLPSPQVVLGGLKIGQADTQLAVEKLIADVNARALLSGFVDIPTMTLEGVVATLPEAGTPETEAAKDEAKSTPEKPAKAAAAEAETYSVRIGTVSIPAWTVKRGEGLYAKGSARLEDILGADAKFSGDAELPGVSPDAKASVTGSIKRANESFSLEGDAKLTQADLAQAVGQADLASAVLDADLSFSGTSPDDIAFTLGGKITASGAADVAGKISGKAWWKAGEFTANDFTWDSPGLHLLADGSRKTSGEIAVKVREAEASKDGLRLLLGAASTKEFHLDARKGTKLLVKDLVIGRGDDGTMRWATGDASVDGIDVKKAKDVLLENLKAKIHLEEGTLHISEATASGLSLAGELTPSAKGAVKFNLAAAGDLSNPMLASALPPSIADAPKGKIELKRLSGIWHAGGGLPADLAIEGTLADGALNLNTDRLQDKIRGLVMSFASDGKVIRAKAEASSEHMGAIKLEGTCDAATRATDATVSFSLSKLAASFLPPGNGAEITQAMLEAFDGASYAASFRMPASAKEPGSFTFENKGDAPLKVQAALLLDDKLGVTTGEITADAEVPFAPAAKAFPVATTGDGKAVVHFARTADGRFSGSADLSAASLRVDPYLNKRAGGEVRVNIDGSAAPAWKLEHLTLDLLGQSIALTPKDDGLAANDLKLDLAKLAPLFPEGSEAAGSVSGDIGTAPVSATLQLAEVRLKTPSGIAIDEINGGLTYAPDALRCDGLHVVAYGSDFSINGAMKDGKWTASLKGVRADLNTLAALRVATGSGPEPSSGKPASGAKQHLSGTVDTEVDEVFYRKATVNNFKAHIHFSPEEFDVDDISCAPYGGTASGAVSIHTPPGGSGSATAKIAFDNVDLKLIDDLSTNEPRGMYGPATGKVDLSFPVGADAKPYMDVDGDITASAKDGSLGKAGASGKVLAALRTTELAQLKIPSLRDKGLSFTTADTHIVFNHGLMTLDNFDLAERTHTMSAKGTVDFPQDSMDITLRVQLLASVREIVGAIPLLDGLAQAGGIYISFTGSPFNPKVDATRIRPIEDLRRGGGGILKGVKGLLGR